MLQLQDIDVCFSNCLRSADGHLAPYTSLSCLVALDDVTLDNGPVRLVEGSHLVGQRVIDSTVSTNDVSSGEGKENFKEANGSRVITMDMGDEDGTPITMSRGQVLIMHCHMMHCSQPNLSDRPRRILFTRYADADAVEVYNPGTPPRLGRLLCGTTKFPEVARFGENRCARAPRLPKQHTQGRIFVNGIFVVDVILVVRRGRCRGYGKQLGTEHCGWSIDPQGARGSTIYPEVELNIHPECAAPQDCTGTTNHNIFCHEPY
eukprot:COSAG02_NODE_1016_length_15190_cov_128.667418_15_plen_262_part_00